MSERRGTAGVPVWVRLALVLLLPREEREFFFGDCHESHGHRRQRSSQPPRSASRQTGHVPGSDIMDDAPTARLPEEEVGCFAHSLPT